MILGIPKEILENETRVAVIPATVKHIYLQGLMLRLNQAQD